MSLFDHLIGKREQIVGNFYAEGLCSFEVDDQLKFGRLQHRQVGRPLALENTAGIDAGLTITVVEVSAVAYEPAGFDRRGAVRTMWEWRSALPEQRFVRGRYYNTDRRQQSARRPVAG